MSDMLDLIYEAFENLNRAKEEKNLEQIKKLEKELFSLRKEFVKNSGRRGKVLPEN